MADIQQFMPKNNEVIFSAVQEPWTIYNLEDGTIIRVRPILVRVTDTGKKNQDGSPERQFQFHNIVDIQSK